MVRRCFLTSLTGFCFGTRLMSAIFKDDGSVQNICSGLSGLGIGFILAIFQVWGNTLFLKPELIMCVKDEAIYSIIGCIGLMGILSYPDEQYCLIHASPLFTSLYVTFLSRNTSSLTQCILFIIWLSSSCDLPSLPVS